MTSFFLPNHRSAFMGTLALSIPLCILMVLWTPSVTVEKAERNAQPIDYQNLPIQVDATEEPMTIQLIVTLRRFQSDWLHLRGDDCITSLTINEKPVNIPSCELQDAQKGISLDGSHYLVIGNNRITLDVKDVKRGSQGVDVLFPFDGGLLWFLRSMIIVCVSMGIFFSLQRFSGVDTSILCITLLGIAVRILYSAATDYDVRAHDIGGHLDYIRFVASHWTLPPGSGYEYHQAPLYYFLVAPILWFGSALGWSETQGIQWIQLASLLFSFLTVYATVWLGSVIFGRESDPWKFRIFLLVSLLLPRIVMLSTAISNDALVLTVMTITLCYVMEFWRTGSRTDFYRSLVSFSLSFLTKLNAVIFLPVFAVLLFRTKRPWKAIGKEAAIGLMIVVVLTGWLPVMRLMQSDHDLRNVVNFGKGGGNTEGLKVSTSIVRFTTFNPVGILLHPYNNPWSDEERRQFFWEYFLRSSLFGEFYFATFRPFAALFLAFMMCMCGYGILAFDRIVRRETWQTLPLALVTLSLIGSAFLYAYVHSYSSEQDFRFSTLLGVTAAYFIARGIVESKGRTKEFGFVCVFCFAVLSLLFFFVV